MKLHLYSDLHLDLTRDKGHAFLDSVIFHSALADVAILAGDITEGNQKHLEPVFETFAAAYSHTIFVAGNHEYYGSDQDTVNAAISRAAKEFSRDWKNPYAGKRRFHWLNNDFVEIDGQRFLGGTMWTPYAPMNQLYEGMMRDFYEVKGLAGFCYEENANFRLVLNNYLREEDIVVTHHLPHQNSVHPKYKGSGINCFFLSDMSDIIEEFKPKLWCHGHSHERFDYAVGDTRIVAHPRGYVGERADYVNYAPKLIEI